MHQIKPPSELLDQIPGLDHIRARLVENAREKRLLTQLKKLAEQREKVLAAQKTVEAGT